MPGPMTHYIFYMQLKDRLQENTLKQLSEYDKYSIFAQGHDLFIYYNFYKIWNQRQLNGNIELAKRLQEFQFREFVYIFLKTAQVMNVLTDQQVRIFIEGYIGHHILDAYTHPMIIYYSGDHIRSSQNKTWRHGIAENLLDIYMMKSVLKENAVRCPVYKYFRFSKSNISEKLVEVLDKSLNKVYGYEKGGKIVQKACSQMALFMQLFKYDLTGAKRIVFDILDPVLKGTASFSYHRREMNIEVLLNEKHNIWCNPMEGTIKSDLSFLDLYEKALCKCADIIEKMEKICTCESISRETIYPIIPDIAATHGLLCGKTIEINYTNEKVKLC